MRINPIRFSIGALDETTWDSHSGADRTIPIGVWRPHGTRQTASGRVRVLLIGLPSRRALSGYSPAISLLAASTFAQADLRERVVFKLVNARTLIPGDLADLIRDFEPDLVGFSALVWNHARIIEFGQIARDQAPKAAIVVGCSNAPWLVESNPDLFDVGVAGEGETPFQQLLRLLVDYPGKARERLATLPRAQLLAIQGLRLPHERLVAGKGSYGETPISAMLPYHAQGYGVFVTDTIYLETLRGCPFHCSFCGIADASDKPRRVDPAVVEREIAWAAEKNLVRLLLCDSAVNYRTADAERLLRLLDRHFPNGGLVLDAQFNFDFFKPEQIPLFKALPIESVTCGLQSTNPPALDKMHRRFRLDRFARVIESLIGEVPLRFDLILGLPGDDPEGFFRTLDFLAKYPVEANVNIMNVMPQTDAWRQREAWGLEVYEKDGWVIRQTPTFRADELADAVKRIAHLAQQKPRNGFRVKFEPEFNQTEEVSRHDIRLKSPHLFDFPFDIDDIRYSPLAVSSLDAILHAPDEVMRGWSVDRAFLFGPDIAGLRLRDAQGDAADLWMHGKMGGEPQPDLEVGSIACWWDDPFEAYVFEAGAVDATTGECTPRVGPKEGLSGAVSTATRADWLARIAPLLRRDGPASPAEIPPSVTSLSVARGVSTVTFLLEQDADRSKRALSRGLGHRLSHSGSSVPRDLTQFVREVGAAFSKLGNKPATTAQACESLRQIIAQAGAQAVSRTPENSAAPTATDPG